MSDSSRRSFLRGIATTGVAAVGLGAAGTAAADDKADRTISIDAREDLEYKMDFFHPSDDGDDFRRVSGTLDDGEWATHETKGVISTFYVDGDAALYTDTLDESWFQEHKVTNPRDKTVIGDGETEYTIYDGKNNEYSGNVANGDETYSIDTGIAVAIINTPGNGDFFLY